jgi:hypothetical protein
MVVPWHPRAPQPFTSHGEAVQAKFDKTKLESSS